MNDMPEMPPAALVPPWAPAPDTGPAPTRRWLRLMVGVGAAAGVAVGATALAQAATASGGTTPDTPASVTASTSTTTTVPGPPKGFGPGRARYGLGGPGFGGPVFGGPLLGGGPVIDGQFTIKGPNGYETLAERTGTVSSVTNTSGSTWSLTVKSADGSSGTFTVDTGTSVDGGEMGIGSVKSGDTVQVTAVVSGGTATAKQVTDDTVLKANGGTWWPKGPPSDANPGSGTAAPSSVAPPV
jgi:hypothetical protein